MSNFTQIKIWIKLDLQHRIGAAKNIKGFCCRAVLTICHDRAGVSSWLTLLFIARVWWGGPAFTRNHCHRHANQLRWISDKWNQQKKQALNCKMWESRTKSFPKRIAHFVHTSVYCLPIIQTDHRTRSARSRRSSLECSLVWQVWLAGGCDIVTELKCDSWTILLPCHTPQF